MRNGIYDVEDIVVIPRNKPLAISTYYKLISLLTVEELKTFRSLIDSELKTRPRKPTKKGRRT